MAMRTALRAHGETSKCRRWMASVHGAQSSVSSHHCSGWSRRRVKCTSDADGIKSTSALKSRKTECCHSACPLTSMLTASVSRPARMMLLRPYVDHINASTTILNI
jgi:hypothetical protein